MGQSLYPYYRLSHENEDCILHFIYKYFLKYNLGQSLYPYYRLSHENEDSILHFIYVYFFNTIWDNLYTLIIDCHMKMKIVF